MNLFDLHTDTPTALFKGVKPAASFPNTIENQVQTCAIFLKDDTQNPYDYYRSVLSDFKAKTVHPINDLSSAKSVILAVEGGAVLEGKKENLFKLFSDGVVLLSLAWNGETELAGGVDTNKDLTLFGKEVITEMNRLGMVLDLSHLNDKSFYSAAETGEYIVASHSNSRTVFNHKRNLTDKQLLFIKEKSGLVGVNLYPCFLGEGNPLENTYKHISHMLDLGLLDNIAIGSDFDGAKMSSLLDTTEKMPLLYEFLEKKGINIAIIDKIFYYNALNFFKNVFDIRRNMI